jgi:transposase-like protein
MARKNRYYPPEFKREALAMLATGEYTMAELERELGITPGLVKGWKRKGERKGEYGSA